MSNQFIIIIIINLKIIVVRIKLLLLFLSLIFGGLVGPLGACQLIN